MTTTYRADIDGLRAIAILAVVVFHAFPQFLPGGFVGVDIFFVISGFLITGLIVSDLDAGRFSLRTFYARRIKRIFPILSVVLASAFLFGWFVLYSDAYATLGKHMAAAAAFISNFVYLGESGYFDVDASAKPLLHLWSLAIEEQFYFVWPVLLVYARRARKMDDGALLKLLLVISLASLAYGIHLTRSDPGTAYYQPFARFWELSLGGIAVLLSRQYRITGRTADLLAWTGLAMLVCACLLIDKDAGFPGYLALLPCLGTAALLLGAAESAAMRKALSHKALVFVGLTSYSFYLWHWPALFFLNELVVDPAPLQILATLVLSFALAVTGYYLVETPVRRMGSSAVPVVLFVMLALIGYLGFNAYKRNGLDFREVNGRIALGKLLQQAPASTTTQDQATRLSFALDQEDAAQLALLIPKLRKDSTELQKIRDDSNAVNNQQLFCSGALVHAGGCGKAAGDAAQGRRVVLVVGDSHAANVHHALTLAYPDITFVPFIDGGCVPISKRYQKPDSLCGKVVHGAMAHVQNHHVDLVLLTSRWLASFEEVAPDIAHYKQYVRKIALVGPSLTFKKDVYRILSDYEPPAAYDDHVQESFQQRNVALNAAMRAFALEQGISYVDKISLFCRGTACPLFEGQKLMIYDKGHLTASGTARLANSFGMADPVTAILRAEQPVLIDWKER